MYFPLPSPPPLNIVVPIKEGCNYSSSGLDLPFAMEASDDGVYFPISQTEAGLIDEREVAEVALGHL